MIRTFTAVIAAIILFATPQLLNGQVDSVLGQVTSVPSGAFAGGVSGDGRLIVFESNGNVATENPRNDDFNNEIFIFDFAQRRIYQITDTKSARNDPNFDLIPSNTFVNITNSRPAMSTDGRWIVFSSNATSSVAGSPVDGTNPGNFDAEALSTFTETTNEDGETEIETENPIAADANMELWLYEVPAVAAADMTTGDEIAATDLSTGSFTQITNTAASIPSVPGSSSQVPFVSADNISPSITDDGSHVAFISNRDINAGNNSDPEDNPEVFVYSRTAATTSQITQTPRGAITNPITQSLPNIAGNGSRLVFASNAENPVIGMTGGSNADNNREIFVTDLDANGAATGTPTQLTTTEATTPGFTVNLLGIGKRLSRDGNLLVFDSFADLANENSGENFDSFGTYLFDLANDTVRRITERSDGDENAAGGDVERLATFTDYVGDTPSTLLFETRLNIAPNGLVPEDPEDGLNNTFARAAQIYSYPLNEPVETAVFTRRTQLVPPSFLLTSVRIFPTDSLDRIVLNVQGAELGLGNSDLSNEVYYLLQPTVTRESPVGFSFATGATNIPVQNTPLGEGEEESLRQSSAKVGKSGVKPLLGGTPTPSPTPTPTPPTPTPAALQGLSPGMLAVINFTTGITQPTIARTAVGDMNRRFPLPIQLSGVTMTINGVAAGLKRVSQRQIEFVMPRGLQVDVLLPIVINNNGTVYRGEIFVSRTRPDIFRTEENPEANRARILNVTNRIFTREPFDVTTFRLRGSRRVPTILRMWITGVRNVPGSTMSIRFGEAGVSGAIATPVEREPGIYTIDFELVGFPTENGDQPVVISILTDIGGFTGRLDADAPRIRTL